jgi:hypothetical protein
MYKRVKRRDGRWNGYVTVFATGQDAMISRATSVNRWAEQMQVQMGFIGPWQSD